MSQNGVTYSILSEDPLNTSEDSPFNCTEWASGNKSNIPGACPRYSQAMTIFLAITLGFIAVGTTLGNILVIMAISLVRKLQTPSNNLIVSLACSDLLVAVLVLPFAIISQLNEYWIFNERVCDFFIACDVLLCTSSILNLCAISIDRYLVITRPLQYAVNRTPCRMAMMIAAVWIVSALISIPPIIGWKEKFTPGYCTYSEELAYQIYATFGAFYIPLIVMLVLYGRIFKLAAKMARLDARQKVSSHNCLDEIEPMSRNSGTSNTLGVNALDTPTPRPEGRRLIRFKSPEANCCLGESQLSGSGPQPPLVPNGAPKKHSDQSSANSEAISATHGVQAKKCHHKKVKSNSETKAIKTLGVIMGCFTLCWLPFFIIQLISPFLQHFKYDKKLIPGPLIEVFLWLGYVNSFLNPVIYAKFNRDFRTPFKEILMFHCSTINQRLRSESYAEQFGLPLNSVRRESHSLHNTTRRRSSDVYINMNRRTKGSTAGLSSIASSLGRGRTSIDLGNGLPRKRSMQEDRLHHMHS